MAELIDPRPVFTIVMGCNGVGKSAWKRANQDLLPDHYFDQDSVANGVGGWDNTSARARTRLYVDAQIDECIRQGVDFGTESTYSGRPGRELVARAVQAGYRIEGLYLGTNDPGINIARVKKRVLEHTGHMVDPARIPTRWRYSLSNLRRTADLFDSLRLLDNSEDRSTILLEPPEQCELKRGDVVWRADSPAPWCKNWLAALRNRKLSLAKLKAKRKRQSRQGGRGR